MNLRKNLLTLLEASRPRQWIKNGVVFAGLIFGQRALDAEAVSAALLAFVVFCLLSSSTYLVNDVVDLKRDRQHPLKCHRPVASGRLSSPSAILGAVAFVAIAMGLSTTGGMNWRFGVLAVSYYGLSIAYSLVLKKAVILDVFVVAAGFVIRAAAGAHAVNVAVSPWLLICAMLLALFLALSKRRHELTLLGDAAARQRTTLSQYTPYLLDQMIAVVTASTVVSYCLYTMWPETVQKFGTHNLVYTIPFVLFGIYRYLYLVHRAEQGGAPERILVTDIPMLVDVALWLVAVGVVLYGGRT